jgi:putative addiction module component (TIGR02574 family)
MNRSALEQILDLPPAERLAIVQEIWQSVVEDSASLPLSSAQSEELERRWLDLQQNPDAADSWDDVKKSLRSE